MAQRVSEFATTAGRLDVMINNAGVLLAGNFEDIDAIAQDVAKAVEPSWLRCAIHQVHFRVGSQTKVMAAGSRFSPSSLTRLANRRLAQS
jgi:NAD(P)-dependent dehydrogenase (short-subunit alcohol dehydrogenase family)